MLKKALTLLQGKKSYIVAVGMFVYAVLAVCFHQITWQDAIMFLFGSGTLVSIRSAMKKLQ